MSNKYEINHNHEFIMLKNDFEHHVADGSNPHGITKGQIGLSNVENIAPTNLPVSDATRDYVDKNAVKSMQVKYDTINNKVILVLKNGNGDTLDSDPVQLPKVEHPEHINLQVDQLTGKKILEIYFTNDTMISCDFDIVYDKIVAEIKKDLGIN